jgi:trigger factor
VSPLKLDIQPLPEDKTIKYTVAVDVLPKIELKEYMGLEVEIQELPEVTEKQVSNTITSYQEEHARLIPVSGRGISEMDVIDCALVLKSVSDNREIENLEDYSLHAERADNLFRGLKNALLGAEQGSDVVFRTNFPEQYGEDLKGKDAEITIKIKNIRERKLPVLDDEFANEVGGFKSIEELRNDIRQRIEKNTLEINELLKEKFIIDRIIEINPFEPPVSLVDRYIKSMKTGHLDDVHEKDKEQITEDDRKKFEEHAKKTIRRDILLKLIAEKEGFEITDEELNQEIESQAAKEGSDAPKVRTYYKNEDNRDDLKYGMKIKKTIDILKRYTNFKTKSPIITDDTGIIKKPDGASDGVIWKPGDEITK